MWHKVQIFRPHRHVRRLPPTPKGRLRQPQPVSTSWVSALGVL